MKTADLIDEHGDALTLVHLPFQFFGQVDHFSGPVETLSCFEDNQLVKDTVSQPGNGRVLVVDGGGSTRTALVGDMVAETARQNGWAGLVINGAIRDSVDIHAMTFGVKTLGTSPVKSAKTGHGTVGQPIHVGGVMIAAGGWIYADADGVLYSASEL